MISILHFASLGIIKPLGDVLFGNGATTIIKQLKELGSIGVSIANYLNPLFQDKYRTLYILMGIALIMVLFKNIFRFIQEYIAGYITNIVAMDIANELFLKVQTLPIKYFSKEGSSQITARFVNDIPAMGTGLTNVFGKAIREPLKAIGSFGLAMMINWKLTLLVFVIFPPAGIFLKQFGTKVKRSAKKKLIKQGSLMAILQETFQGMRIVKAYQMEDNVRERFIDENKKVLHYQLKLVKARAATSPIMETFITGAGIGVLIFSAHLVIDGKMSTGDFCAFYAALGAMFDPVRKLANLNNIINTSAAAGERVFELMDKVPDIQNKKDAKTLAPIHDNITFDNVSFSYESGTPVLQDVSFSVKHGEHIALVGPSGAGKSTLVSLLLRLHDVDNGAIIIDDHDIKEITKESLREQVGLVTQTPFLFNESIAGNISCQRGDFNYEKIKEAAKSAYSENFIENLSEKYDTLYGPGGIDISGGQQHRVALARAIYKNPKILILDEAMANLDAESEHYVLTALDEFTKGITTFTIAHRFSTIEKVDKILVLDHGKVVGFGSHKELMETSPVYRNLYERQMLM